MFHSNWSPIASRTGSMTNSLTANLISSPSRLSLTTGWVLLLCLSPLGSVLAQQPVLTTEWQLGSVIENNSATGRPFGVGTILIPVGRPESKLRVIVSCPQDRIHYSVASTEELIVKGDPPPINRRRIGQGALINRIKDVIKNARDKTDPPSAIRISYLFRGDTPFDVQLSGDLQQTIHVDPTAVSPVGYRKPTQRQLLGRWWTQYTDVARQQVADGDYSPLLETYLVNMLSRRLSLPPVDLREQKKVEKGEFDQPLSTLSLLAGTDAIRDEVMRKSLLTPPVATSTTLPLPVPQQWPAPLPPAVPNSLPIESIATAVPTDFLYLRFGSFSNYLWFQQLSASRGGDFLQLAMMRGYNYENSKRIERMLNTKTTAVARLFGDQIINDMAIIGADLYMQEGASMGVLFEAKNAALLTTSLAADRTSAVTRLQSENCSLESVQIAGRDVSLLSTPDNSVHSYLAQNGNFVLLATSRYVVERFFAVADGETPMAGDPNFRYARLLLPVQNDYSTFAYISPQFLQHLIGPHYQIELRRRHAAIAAIQMAELARLAAESEGDKNDSIEDLIGQGYLPGWFNDRADGSQTLRTQNGWIDSTRGKHGSFLPIADTEIRTITPQELSEYQSHAEYYANHWQQTDPVIFGLRRFAIPERPEQERIALEGYLAPFDAKKLSWVSDMLAPPIQTEIALPADDIVNFQVHLAGNKNPNQWSPDHVVFGGLKDMTPPQPGEKLGLFGTLKALNSTPAYVGAWPAAGYLDRLPLGLGGTRPDEFGFSRALIGMWRWQGGGVSLLSFDRSIIENCLDYIAPVETRDPAQLRVTVKDLGPSQLASWVNTFWYRRAYETSLANAALLDAMKQQLGVAPEKAKETAERLLDCTLQCPIGGSYQLQPAGAASWWISDAWQAERKIDQLQPPAGYQTPFLEWFRGGQVHVTQLVDKLVLVGQFDMQPIPLPPAAEEEDAPATLPTLDFDLFKNPFGIFGGGDKPKKKPAPAERRAF